MKTIFYILAALFVMINVTSCTTDSVAEYEEITIEEVATEGEDGQYEDEDQGGA